MVVFLVLLSVIAVGALLYLMLAFGVFPRLSRRLFAGPAPAPAVPKEPRLWRGCS